MASAGTVTLELDANSVKLMRELQRSTRRTQMTARKMRRHMEQAFKAIAAAAVATAAAVAAAVRSQARAIDDLAKTADALGVTTESLQALQLMARLTGTSAQQLATNMERMQRRIGQVARDGGPAANALRDIGVSLDDIINLSADKQMEVLAKALSGVENAAIRASIANDLFGRDGVRMLKLMDQLATDGIGSVARELEALGVAVSRTDAAGVERMNDALLKAQTAASGVAQQFTIHLSHSVAAVAEAFFDAAKQQRGFQDEAVAGAAIVTRGFGVVADAVSGLIRLFQVLGRSTAMTWEAMRVGAWQFVDTLASGPARAMNALIEQMNRLPGISIDARGGSFFGIDEMARREIQRGEAFIREGAADIQEILMRPMPSLALEARIDAIRAQLEEARAAAGGLFDMAEETNSATKGMTDEQKRAAEIFRQTRTELELYAEQLNEAFALFQADEIDAETYWRFVDQIEEGLIQIEEQAEETANAMSVYADQAARNMQSHFADFLFDPFDKGLKGMLRGFIDTIRRMVAEAAAARIFESLPGGGIGGFLGGLFGGARASGGPVSANKAYLVGERGPELVVPRSAGTVVPNHAMGGSVTVNIDARGSDDPGRLLALVPVIQTQIEQSMSLKMRRGYL